PEAHVGAQQLNLKPGHPALKGRTMYLKSITPPERAKRLLQPASTNTKMGAGKGVIVRGQWRGMPLYLLTLEERKTCPTTGQQWSNCYGNNMPFARRIDHTGKLFPTLEAELATLSAKHPTGFVVRLHVLGDFYSKGYVRFWIQALSTYPSLRVYGYTHR